jgi:glutamate racemase
MNAASDNTAELPIGLFDSGVGGLTVLAALRKRLPQERYCYLGDTARLPYGTKSSATIVRYSLQATEKLVERRIKLLVVACNTATAAALPELQKAYAPLPVVGVIEAGAKAACATVSAKPGGGRIIVMGTEFTIRGEAYSKAIHALKPETGVIGVPCSLLVPLAEEGWMDGPIAESIAERYLAPALTFSRPDCIVLGCTHFPPLAQAIASIVGKDVILVDSAATTAEAVEQELKRLNLLRPEQPGSIGECEEKPSERLHFLTTDAPERFAKVGSLFLGMDITPDQLELVVL